MGEPGAGGVDGPDQGAAGEPGPGATGEPGVVDEATWRQLRALAVEAMGRAYVPYSGYPVGAAAIVDDGRWVSGCNVENAGYGVTLCAECGLVSDLVRGGGGRLVAFTCVNRHGERIVPCGRCRQLLSEHAHADMLLDMPLGVMTMDEVLPHSFAASDLARAASAAGGVDAAGQSAGASAGASHTSGAGPSNAANAPKHAERRGNV